MASFLIPSFEVGYVRPNSCVDRSNSCVFQENQPIFAVGFFEDTRISLFSELV